MSFIEKRFPTNILFPWEYTAKFSTDLIENFGGYDYANKNWTDFLWEFKCSFRKDDWTMKNYKIFLLGVCQGMGNRFRFKHPDFYKLYDPSLGDRPALTSLGTKQYQLYAEFNYEGNSIRKKVTKPVHNGIPTGTNTIKIYVNGSHIPYNHGTYPWTLNAATGIVTATGTDFVATPTAEGEYDIPVRLDSDESTVAAMTDLVREMGAISLKEVRT